MTTKPHLKKTLGSLHIWGLGVGLVISGDYFGWNLGLVHASPLIMLLTVLVVGIFYLSFIFCYTELVSMVPNSGGPFSFATAAFGHKIGMIAGAATLIEFLFAPPAIALSIGSYVHHSFPSMNVTYVAIGAFIAFGLLNCVGMLLAANFELVVTLLATAELFIFFALTGGHVEFANVISFKHEMGLSHQIFSSIPFAIWFFLGIEGVAMCVEETKNPRKNIPRGLISAIVMLVVLALGVITCGTGILPIAELTQGDSPLPKVMSKAISPDSIFTHMLVSLGVFGLMASFHGIILGASRQVFALSRARFLPHKLAYISAKTSTPIPAIILCVVVGIIAVISGKTAALIIISCLGAIVMYLLSLLSYIKLRFSGHSHGGYQDEDSFRAPLFPILPILAAIVAVFMLVLTLVVNVNESIIFCISLAILVVFGFVVHGFNKKSEA